MASELTVVVSADIGLPIVLFLRSHVSGEGRLDRAMVLRERRIARNVLREVFCSRYRGTRTELDVVLPGDLPLPRPEKTGESAGSRALVPAFSGSHETLPTVGDLVGRVERIGGERLVIEIVGRGAGIEVRAAVALEYRETQFVPCIHTMGDLPGDVGVSVTIPVEIVLAERSGGFRRVETLALEVSEIQAEVRVADGAVDTTAHAARAVRSDAGRGAGCRRVFAALGEDLDHAPDRVGAVQAAQLTGHDLDPLDLAERNVLERRRAERSGPDPHTVHQDQRMTAVRPAHEHAARLPESAVARGLDPAQRLQDFDQSLLATSGDVFGGDDVDRLQSLRAGLRKSGGSDDNGIFITLSKRKRRRGRDERGNDGSSQGFLPRHASPQAELSL